MKKFISFSVISQKHSIFLLFLSHFVHPSNSIPQLKINTLSTPIFLNNNVGFGLLGFCYGLKHFTAASSSSSSSSLPFFYFLVFSLSSFLLFYDLPPREFIRFLQIDTLFKGLTPV